MNMSLSDNYIIKKVCNHYLSNDYSGLHCLNLFNYFDGKNKIISELKYLIENEYIGLLSSDIDVLPSINRFGFPDIDVQIKLLNNSVSFFIYPTSKILKSYNIDESLPFIKCLKEGHPQLKPMFFEYDVLSHYVFDPKFNFSFHDYLGKIRSLNTGDGKWIDLSTFGIGKNNDNIVIVAFPKYLCNMSLMNQVIWEEYRIDDTSNCKALDYYLNNTLYGSWNFPDTVYRSILKEMENINVLTLQAFDKKFFSRIFNKEDLEGFDILFFPSENCYYQYLLLFEKITISNINFDFFKSIMCTVDNDGNTMGTLKCIKEWINQVCSDVVQDIHSPLHKLREERQKPAHKISSNYYDKEFLNRQHTITTQVYHSLNTLRRLLQSHPKNKNICIPYNETQYIEL